MTTNPIDPESEALYRILRGEIHENESNQMSDDEEFAATLRQTAQNIHANPVFQADLEMRLKRISPNESKSTRQWFSGFTRTLAWVAGAAAVVFIISWSIRTLLPQPLVAPTVTMSPSTIEAPTATPTPAATLEATAPVVEGTPSGEVYSSPLFPDNTIVLKAEFPPSPGEAKVYTQNFDEALTIENGLAMAAQLGVNGKVYQVENGAEQMTSYYVTDGISRILFFSPHHFFYVPDYQKILEVIKQDTPTTKEQISIAESFLKDHKLLDFPYLIQTDDTIPGLVRFVQLLDEKSIHYGTMNIPEITIQMSPQGEIRSLNYNVLYFNETGVYPIIGPEEAWQKTLLSGFPKGVEANSRTISPDVNEMWLREYPVGQRVELFGYPEILQPAVVSDSPLIFINNYPLQGNLQELTKNISRNQVMQVWGQFQPDENGNLFFQVEGWQPSPFQIQSLEGVIQRQSGQGYLLVDGKQWLIPGLPDEVPEGLNVYINGVQLENENSLEWSTISTTLGGGGGGGGGGSEFADLNLEREPTPIPVPTETPYPLPQIGDRFDGIQGNPYVTFFKNDDGSMRMNVNMNFQPSEEWPGGLSLNLIGDGLAGIDAYHQLPVKIWGSVTDVKQSVPTVTVERYEPVYSGLKGQAWLGTMELVTLGDKPVLLFTDQSGSKYVLNTSLESESKTPTMDMPFIVEGVIYPDQTYEGYPVIHDFLMFGAQGMENLDDYKPQSISPITLDASSDFFSGQTLSVEKIELVYFTTDIGFTAPDSSMPPIYAQPAWRFFGHYENGQVFEILVQALKDEYLK